MVNATIRLRFYGRSTAYHRSLRSQWRNPLAAVTLTYLFIYVTAQQPTHRYRPTIVRRSSSGRTARSNCMQSSRNCNHHLTHTLRQWYSHGEGQSGKSTASLGVGWIGGGQWKQNMMNLAGSGRRLIRRPNSGFDHEPGKLCSNHLNQQHYTYTIRNVTQRSLKNWPIAQTGTEPTL